MAPSVAPVAVVSSTAPSAAPVADTGSIAPTSGGMVNGTAWPSFAPTEMDDFTYYYSPNKTDQVLGYLQFDYWDGASCDGTKTYVSGYATNQCNKHANGYGSYKVEFNGNGTVFCDNLRTLQYSDTACQNYYGAYAFEADPSCFEVSPGTFLASGKMSCVVGSPVIDSVSTIMSYYALSDTNCGGYANTFEAITNNYCYNVGALNMNSTGDDNNIGDDDYYQWNNDYMTCDAVHGVAVAYSYSNPAGCSQTLSYPYTESESIPLTCDSTVYNPYSGNGGDDDDGDDDLFSSPGAPTMKPSTASPTMLSNTTSGNVTATARRAVGVVVRERLSEFDLLNLEQKKQDDILSAKKNKLVAAASSVAPKKKSNLRKSLDADPTSVPTGKPTAYPSQHNLRCPHYTASNTYSATTNTTACSFTAAGGASIAIAGCGCVGDEAFNLYLGSTLVEYDDNGGTCPGNSGGNCAGFNFVVPGASSTSLTYTIEQGCYSDYTCSGVTTIVGATSLAANPTATPTAAPIMCPAYSAINTNSATQNYATCTFLACGGSTLTISGCNACTNDEYIVLYSGLTGYVASQDDGCGLCSLYSYPVPGPSTQCGNFTIHEGCNGSGQCGGQMTITGSTGVIIASSAAPSGVSTPVPTDTPVPTMRPTRYPTNAPVTLIPTAAGFVAPSWTSTLNTASATQNYYYVTFNACGGTTLAVSGCGACTGDEYTQLWYTNTSIYSYSLLGSDDGCGSGYCTKFTYTVLGASTYCQSFTLKQGCNGSGACASTGITVTGSTSGMTGSGFQAGNGQPTRAPTPAPSASGFVCPAYTSTLNTASATQNYYYCNFNACGGSVIVVSGCGACTGDQYVNLYNANYGYVTSADQGCGSDNCSGFTYYVPGNSTQCSSYSLHEGCFGSNTCTSSGLTIGGSVGNVMIGSGFVSGTGPTYAPIQSPTYAPQSSYPTYGSPSIAPNYYDNVFMKVECSDPNATVAFVPSQQPTPLPTFAPSPTPTFRPSALPTAVPSHTPTRYPTFGVPTATPNTVSAAPSSNTMLTTFYVTYQVIQGFSYSTWQTNTELYTTTFKAAIVATMPGLTPSNIVNFAVIAGKNRRRLSAEEVRELTTSTPNSNVSLSYTVNSYTGANYTTLNYQLNHAISTGAFNEYLGGYAQLYNATALIGATSGEAYGYDVPYSVDISDDDNLSGGAIAGIVIGVLAFVAILLFLAYYFTQNSGSVNNTSRAGSEKPAVASPVEESVNPMSGKASAPTDVEMSSNTTYKKQSAASAGVKKPDVGATVGDDNM